MNSVGSCVRVSLDDMCHWYSAQVAGWWNGFPIAAVDRATMREMFADHAGCSGDIVLTMDGETAVFTSAEHGDDWRETVAPDADGLYQLNFTFNICRHHDVDADGLCCECGMAVADPLP